MTTTGEEYTMIECEHCRYAIVGNGCSNPACVVVNPEAHARHMAEAEKRAAERAERERVRDWAGRNGHSSL